MTATVVRGGAKLVLNVCALHIYGFPFVFSNLALAVLDLLVPFYPINIARLVFFFRFKEGPSKLIPYVVGHT